MPIRKGGYWYYTRTVEGQQYGIHCRRAVAAGRDRPTVHRGRRARCAGEEVLLDGNVEAGGSEFFALGTFDVSPDGHLLAYSIDLGRRRAVHPAGQGPAHRRAAGRRGRRTSFYGSAWSADGAHAVLPDRRRGLAARTGSGGTASAPRPTDDVLVLRGARRAVLGRRRA